MTLNIPEIVNNFYWNQKVQLFELVGAADYHGNQTGEIITTISYLGKIFKHVKKINVTNNLKKWSLSKGKYHLRSVTKKIFKWEGL